MKTISVKDLVVPLSEYATIPVGSSLIEAVNALEKAQEEFDATKYRHRAIIVLDAAGNVVGKVSQHDVLRALEPKYCDIGAGARNFGFSASFLKSMCQQYQLFDRPMDDICRKAADVKVENCMSKLGEGEFIELEATMDMAIHQLVMGHHQSLLVKKENKVVGVLRLTDVFAAVFHTMKECRL